MTLKIGSKYILRFKINEKDLVYVAIIKDDDGTLITFEDKYGKEFSYNKSILITAEEVDQ
ncbi:MAG: hypothetical protein WC758_07630 [Candidatus Woesearchaeota archaeon]|jgi:hypothetical protein